MRLSFVRSKTVLNSEPLILSWLSLRKNFCRPWNSSLQTMRWNSELVLPWTTPTHWSWASTTPCRCFEAHRGFELKLSGALLALSVRQVLVLYHSSTIVCHPCALAVSQLSSLTSYSEIQVMQPRNVEHCSRMALAAGWSKLWSFARPPSWLCFA